MDCRVIDHRIISDRLKSFETIKYIWLLYVVANHCSKCDMIIWEHARSLRSLVSVMFHIPTFVLLLRFRDIVEMSVIMPIRLFQPNFQSYMFTPGVQSTWKLLWWSWECWIAFTRTCVRWQCQYFLVFYQHIMNIFWKCRDKIALNSVSTFQFHADVDSWIDPLPAPLHRASLSSTGGYPRPGEELLMAISFPWHEFVKFVRSFKLRTLDKLELDLTHLRF